MTNSNEISVDEVARIGFEKDLRIRRLEQQNKELQNKLTEAYKKLEEYEQKPSGNEGHTPKYKTEAFEDK